MALSSANIELAKPNNFEHNDRTLNYILEYIFSEYTHKNEINRSAKEARKLYENYIREAQENYKKRTKQRIQTDPKKFLWSCVINLNANHTLKDLENLCDVIQQKYGWREVQIVIHNDEGTKGENGELKRQNKHAHIEFCMLDENGIYRFKKRDFGKKDMSEFQTLVAQTLQMERGHNYFIEQQPKPKRLSARQYAQEAKRREKEKQEVKNTISQTRKQHLSALLREKNTLYRQQMQEAHAKRLDYAEWEAIKRLLQDKIKLNQISADELNAYFTAQEQRIKELQTKNTEQEQQIQMLQSDLNAEKAKNDELAKKINENDLNAKESDLKAIDDFINETTENETKDINDDENPSFFNNVKTKIIALWRHIKNLQTKIQTLKSKNDELEAKNAELEKLASVSKNDELRHQNAELQLKLLATNLKIQKEQLVEYIKSYFRNVKNIRSDWVENKNLSFLFENFYNNKTHDELLSYIQNQHEQFLNRQTVRESEIYEQQPTPNYNPFMNLDDETGMKMS